MGRSLVNFIEAVKLRDLENPSLFDARFLAIKVKGKGKAGIAVHGTPSYSYGVLLAIWPITP